MCIGCCSRLCGGWAINGKAEDNQGHGKEGAFNGHGDEVSEADGPSGAGGCLKGQENDHNNQGRGQPGRARRKAKILEDVLDPYEGDYHNLWLLKCLGQGGGAGEDDADFV